MAITYANFANRYTRTYDEPFGDQHVLLYDLVAERTAHNFLDRLRTLDPALRNSSCVVLRGRTRSFLDTLRGDRLLWSVLQDVPTVALTGSLEDGKIVLTDSQPFRPPHFRLPVEILRSIEIQSIVNRNGALLGPHHDYHYELLSGDHAAAFLRLGNALMDPIEVTRMCDWILPHLNPRSGIVADTGGLLPLLFCLRDEARQLYGWQIPIRTIASYPVDPDETQQVANDLVRELGPGGNVLFLVSVSSSGRLIRGMIKLLLPMPHSLLIVCDTAISASDDALLHLPIQRWQVSSSGRCEMCESKALIHIDHSTYERVLFHDREPVRVKWDVARERRQFWEAADRTDAVHLHYDLVTEDQTARHYGIYIDVAALLKDDGVRQETLNALRRIDRPRIAMIPRHRASEAVRELLLEAYRDVEVLLIAPGQLSEEVVTKLSSLSANDCVLVADDGLVSGATLNNLRPVINKVFKDKNAIPSIKAFVVLARPSRQGALRDVRNRYREEAGPQFTSVYQIYLPDYRDCPWCSERTRLQGAVEHLHGTAREFAMRRIEQLTGPLRGKFLLGSDSTDETSRSVGSFFGTLKHCAGFAAAASAIYEQWLTATGDQEDTSTSPKTYYVDVPTLLNNYFADAFAPAILRTMKRKHITYVGQNQAIIDFVETIDAERAFPCIIPELLWAAAESKLPYGAAQKLLGKIRHKTPEILLLEELIPKP